MREQGGKGESGRKRDGGAGDGKRRLRDEKMNEEGKKLYGYLGKLGWSILNRNVILLDHKL